MKKTLAVILAVLMLMAALTACGSKSTASSAATSSKASSASSAASSAASSSKASSASSAAASSSKASGDLPKVTIWSTGSQNLSDTLTAVIAAYNKRSDRTANVELQYILSGAGDEALYSRVAAAYKAKKTNTEFDIVAENTSDMQKYIDSAGTQDIFRNIDYTKIANYSNVILTPSILKGKVVPYRGTTVVFAYNSEKLTNPPKTWDELKTWIAANPTRFAYNTPDSGGAGKAFVQTAIYRTLPAEARMSSDEKWTKEYDAGFKYLTEIHPNLYKSGGGVVYPTKNQGTLDLLASGSVDLIPAWADNVMTQTAKGTLPKSTKMYEMTDASLTGTDVSVAITSIGAHNTECYDFINYMISVEGQQQFVDGMAAVPVIDASKLKQDDTVKAVSALNPKDFAFISIGGLETKINDRWQEDISTLK